MRKQLLRLAVSGLLATSILLGFGAELVPESWRSSIYPRNALASTEQPTLVTQFNSGYYCGPDNDFCIWMPGELIENTSNLLMSLSHRTWTQYAIFHQDFTVGPSPEQKYSLLNQFLEQWAREERATVISRIGLQFDGLPAGIEFTALHYDGKKSKNQIIFLGRRMYLLSAINETDLGVEAKQFFDSFRIN